MAQTFGALFFLVIRFGVILFPVIALFALRSGGRRRLWIVTGAIVVALGAGAAVSASPMAGTRSPLPMATHGRYGRCSR